MEKRWPGWVYDGGTEPDPRFSFANERTYLAWVRTALAFLAGGVALQALPLGLHETTRHWLALLFVVLAIVSVLSGWLRWARAERAMRQDTPLPAPAFAAVLAIAVAVAGVALLVALVVG